MATTDELGITLIDSQQAGAAVKVDEAFQTLSGATNGQLDIDVSAGGTITLTAAQLNNDLVMNFTTSPAGAFTVDIPDGKRLFIAQNSTTKDATVDTVTGASATISVPAGARVLIRCLGTDLEEISSNSLDIHLFLAGTYTNTQLHSLYVVRRAFTLPIGLTGTTAYALVAPADAAKAFDIQKNESSIGSIDFAQSSKTATYTFATATSFAAGDRLELYGPGTADSALADMGVTFRGLIS